MKLSEASIEELIQKVQESPKYQPVIKSLIKKLVREEITKSKKPSQVIKSVRTRLHQIGGAYLAKRPDYSDLVKTMNNLSTNLEDAQVADYCKQSMVLHASTAERLEFIEFFFASILEQIGPIHSIADLACGFTPLAIPFMPLTQDFTYTAYDIYEDMLDFLNQFFKHFEIKGFAYPCDVTQPFEMPHVQLALLLKTLPCLEQQEKQIGNQVLERINADHILVSFPSKSLGGHEKGMRRNYSSYIEGIVDTNTFSMAHFAFTNEIAFLLTRRS